MSEHLHHKKKLWPKETLNMFKEKITKPPQTYTSMERQKKCILFFKYFKVFWNLTLKSDLSSKGSRTVTGQRGNWSQFKPKVSAK